VIQERPAERESVASMVNMVSVGSDFGSVGNTADDDYCIFDSDVFVSELDLANVLAFAG
jgi:hypothetical protein